MAPSQDEHNERHYSEKFALPAEIEDRFMTGTGLESRVQAFGREIFSRLDRQGPVLFSKSWWDDRLMGLTMDNEALKVQLFRFVDTLPYLINDPKEIARHLREYLGEAGDKIPWWVRFGLKFLPNGGLGGQVLAYSARTNASRMARKFIAGSNVPEAVEAVARLREQQYAFTVDLLGEATITEAEADHVQKQYLDLIAGLTDEVNHWDEIPEIDRDDRGPIPRVNVSVKLSALFSQFDPIDPEGTTRAVCKRLRPILSAAKATGAFVNFDMEQHSFKDTTLHIFRSVLSEPEFRDWPHVGIAIQAYLKDTEADLHQLLDWAKNSRKCPVWIRLVKGAYWDYETVIAAQQGWPVPVFTQKWQSDANFEKLTAFLIQNHDWLTPAFGSHNIRSISHALAIAEQLKVPPKRLEFQMLYGMADPIKQVLKSLGQRIRIYTPYGQLLPGMAYLVRRLLENTSNDSFLRQGFAEGLSEEVLLMNPQLHERPMTPKLNGSSVVVPAPQSSFKNEPLTDFAVASNRDLMKQALQSVRGQLGQKYPLVIDNRDVLPQQWLDSVNPSKHSELIGRCALASVEQTKQAIASAARAFETWRETSISERAGLLRRAAEIMRKRRFELTAWIILETGKPWRESDADVAEAIDFCDYYALEAEKLWPAKPVNVPGEDNDYFYEPRGVAAIIAPWNFPLAILCGMAAAAIVTGNTAIMKPAEQSSVIAAKLMEIFKEAGSPPGVVTYLPGIGEEIGPTLVGHEEVALITFTGSLKVALIINQQAAQAHRGPFVKKVIAEMGGKNAVIVDSDADLDEAVKGVVDSAFGYGGQKCSAGSRAIVLESIYDQFLARLIEATKSLTISAADDPGASLGPVIDAESRDRILSFVEKGKHEARLAFAFDVGQLAEQGYFVGPHIFAEVPESSTIAQEEIFGPVLCVIKAKDLNDAIRIANGTKYALTGGVFSRSPAHIAEVKKRFKVGNLYVNRKCTGALVHRQPFGGFKLSGIGSKAGGPDYLLQFVVPRTITENTLRRGFAPEINPED
jgi:RHH-type transcriptional regulator, proline utilization regulon repressor / proline dehydrogenase / delta 1-pyrroline-5-carboxylate dehydrogenase